VTARDATDRKAVPVDRIVDRPRVEPEICERRRILGLAERRNVPREQPLRRPVEV
jgi:hypothetical protein